MNANVRDNTLAGDLLRLSLLFTILLVTLWPVWALAAGEPDEIVRRPYLQSVSPTHITVAWRTTPAMSNTSWVRFGPDPQQLDRVAVGVAVVPASNPAVVDHFVPLEGLDPATRYYYAVGCDPVDPACASADGMYAGGTTEHTFVTSPEPGSSARLLAWIISDTSADEVVPAAVRDAMLQVTAARPPDRLLHSGDMVHSWGDDSEFTDRMFTRYRDVLRRTPLWNVIGNHATEFDRSDSPSQSGPFFDTFTLPRNGESGGVPSSTEAYYAFDHGNVHFVLLDAGDTDLSTRSPMLAWLRADLAAATQSWLVAIFHHPPYTKGSHDSDRERRLIAMRERFVPVLEAAGADLVISGHSHSYERSYLLDGAYGYGAATPDLARLRLDGRVLDADDGHASGSGAYEKPAGRQPREGTVYVVNGNAAARTRGDLGHPVMAADSLAHGSGLLLIEGDRLTYRAIDADGDEIDRFSILKRTGELRTEWVAYHDAVTDVTHGYADAGGPLVDFATGAALPVTLAGSTRDEEGAPCYSPSQEGTPFTLLTDGDEAFGGTVSPVGQARLEQPGCEHVLRLENLDPTKTYVVTATANRGLDPATESQLTRVTLVGATTYAQASSAGVVVHGADSVAFDAGHNTFPGHVARWRDVTAADGALSIISTGDDLAGGGPAVAYAITALRVEQLGPAPPRCQLDTECHDGVDCTVDLCETDADRPACRHTDGCDTGTRCDRASGQCVEAYTVVWTAYNDLNGLSPISSYENAPYVTEHDYRVIEGQLQDATTGAWVPVTVTGTTGDTSGLNCPPPGEPAEVPCYLTTDAGGSFVAGTDAAEIFEGQIDFRGVHHLDGESWQHIVTFDNLDPAKIYRITLTANRDVEFYGEGRFTRVSVLGADTLVNESSDGVLVHGNDSVSLSTGFNTTLGLVARWTEITAADGQFSILSEWDITAGQGEANTKAYAMSGFKLEQIEPAPACATDDDCPDQGACSEARCDLAVGRCQADPIDGPCDDGAACTLGDLCVDGVCASGRPDHSLCDDGDPCTSDVCWPIYGCANAFNLAPCDDGIACTGLDVCAQGLCAGPSSCEVGQRCDIDADQCVEAARPQVFRAFNDLAWTPEQRADGITRITSPNTNTNLSSRGELIDYDTGEPTGVELTVDGGNYEDVSGYDGRSAPEGTDAAALFGGIVDTLGIIAYVNEPDRPLVLTFSNLLPALRYRVVFHGDRSAYGWDRASQVIVSGADAFTNTSSVASDNPAPGANGALFSGPDDDSTRVPSDNLGGYVARFTDIDPGADGEIVLTIAYDGIVPYKAKYASAVLLETVENTVPDCVADTDCDNGINCTADACINGVCVHPDRCIEGQLCDPDSGLCVPQGAEISFVAYNDLAWRFDQPATAITAFTSPDGGSGLPASGRLVDFAGGQDTGVTLTVNGGLFNGPTHAAVGRPLPTDSDADLLLGGRVNALGSISYVNAPDSPLILTLTGLDPAALYAVVFHGDRAAYGWDRASLVTLVGAQGFINTSSEAHDNPEPGSNGALFSGPDDPSTRLPADNVNGYVARFTEIQAGEDGEIRLMIDAGNEGTQRGKYASAVMLQAFNVPVHCADDAACSDGNPCTDDACDLEMGTCVHNPNGAPCDDGITCTIDDRCVDGQCGSGTPDAGLCDDDNPCTDDACDLLGDCVSTDNAAPCDDGIECTGSDQCAGGICAGMDTCPGGSECNPQIGQCEAVGSVPAFEALNDLAWGAGQIDTQITTLTTGVSGELVDHATGAGSGVFLTIAGGIYDGTRHALVGRSAPLGSDADAQFGGRLETRGAVSYIDLPDSPLTLTFSELQPTWRYSVVFHGDRGAYGWDRASRVTLEGATTFINASSWANDNPAPSSGGALFEGPDDPSTRLPADNVQGYVARFDDVSPNAQGIFRLVVQPDGNAGNRGKYGSAILLRGFEPGAGCEAASDCNDDDPCTDDLCDDGTGVCAHTPNQAPCDDGVACTSGDTCADGRCGGVDDCAAGHACDATQDQCVPEQTAVIFRAYNDLAWRDGQRADGITTLTAESHPADYASVGALIDSETGEPIGVTLAVTGGVFNGGGHAAMGRLAPAGTDAAALFGDRVDLLGAVSYVNQPDEALVMTFSGLDPTLTYTLAFHGDRGAYGWDRASRVTLDGAVSFQNESSVAFDNPAPGSDGALFAGPDAAWTRLPADNPLGYVARFGRVVPGDDGEVRLVVSADGPQASKGRYASAVVLWGHGPQRGCQQDADCDDDNPCTDDACEIDGSVCRSLPNDVACDDGIACTTGDRCGEGRCNAQATDDALCDDFESCTKDTCHPTLGCVFDPGARDASPCSDGLACTTDDVCLSGACIGADACVDPSTCDRDADACVDSTPGTPAAPMTAYNDLAWTDGQLIHNITTITSPNGSSGLPDHGELVDFDTGEGTGFTLTVAGGLFYGAAHSYDGRDSPAGTDAHAVFGGRVTTTGSISYVQSPDDLLILTFAGLDPALRYTLVAHGDRGAYGWDRASRVTLVGAVAAMNASSQADDNPDPASGGALFGGIDDPSTRLPADNPSGYVARFVGIDPGADGEVELVVAADADPQWRGKYLSAIMLEGAPP